MSKRKKGGRPRPPVSRPVRRAPIAAASRKIRGHPWLTVGLLAGILLSAIYSVSLFSPIFIAHENSILRLPVLSHVRNVPYIISRDFLLFTSGQFRPFSYVLVAVVRTFVAPEKVLFWHIWLLAFHIANTLLVFAIARHFSPRLAVALTAAAVFGLHPLNTVIVNDINQFYMLLGLTLSLGSLKAYLSFSRSGSKTLYSVAVALFVLATLTARPAFCLGLILLVYELLYERSGIKRALSRLCPFALIPLSLFSLRLWCTPHPLHYMYVTTQEGSFWYSLLSVVGATRQYAGGLLMTQGIPVVLHEIVEKIFLWRDARFLLWAGVNLVLLGGATLALARKRWAALGILFIFMVMIPYASVTYNPVVDYVSWSYLYFPVVGLALFAGGLYELLLRARHRYLRLGFQVAFLPLFLFLGGRSVQLNLYTRSPLAHWTHVLELNQASQTAAYEVGKAHLATGQLPLALHWFFAPMVNDLKSPCLAMARYYCREGNHLASAVHLRFGLMEKKEGIPLEDYCYMAGELLLAAGALDHAEQNLGNVLMANPFHVGAMTRLARVWFLKGFVGEAHRMLDRAHALAPNDKSVARMQEEFRETERAWQDNQPQLIVTPPSPHWLRYVLTQVCAPSLRREIVALSDTTDPNDAVIQLEAMIYLIEDKQFEAAARKAPMVDSCLSGNAYACAAVSRAYAHAGYVEPAIQWGLRALSLDNQSELAWGSLALALALQEKPDTENQKLVKAVAQHPASASMFYYKLGLQKRSTGKDQEAAELFEKALQAQPNNVKALQALSETLLALGRFEQATEVLRRALALNSGDAETHRNLGYALLNQGKNAEGAEALRIAITLDPENAVYHSDLAVCLARLNREAEAIQEFRRATELDPRSADARHKLANTLVSMGNLSEAVAEYREVIKIMPDRHYVHFNLGTVLYRLGEINQAINEFLEEIRYNPKFGDAYARLARLYRMKGENSLARDVVKRAEALGINIDPATLEPLRPAPPNKEE